MSIVAARLLSSSFHPHAGHHPLTTMAYLGLLAAVGGVGNYSVPIVVTRIRSVASRGLACVWGLTVRTAIWVVATDIRRRQTASSRRR
jgi:hypothetical protein